MPRTVARLPKSARAEFKEPLGRIYTDAQELLADAGSPIIAVGDVVTYHLERAGATPHVSVVDGRTEREAVEEEIVEGFPDADTDVHVASDPATLSHELVEALVDAIGRAETTLLVVDGEEDLASLPAVVAAPVGASVVYGQPGEGMVLVNVDSELKERVRDLLGLLETEDAFWRLLDS
ncbi:GTP-dependent dephospho-CoA kinase family protein [Salarchaeum japonicum]|uniref:GTP-dependent dephospho-CoA kinase n=1 Tax=Salarchaeum japonicum TaxID=555573 RepID=A0AAV3T1G1_9EURY|nr:GTP-dependent dephospho-CoA kinase family protein [Salarchaeum japonicum]